MTAHERPNILAIRAVNQYRRRDVVPYLALRYHLFNKAARSRTWAEQVVTELVLSRSRPAYFQALHFKELSSEGTIKHRRLFLPTAVESLAEAALLAECAKSAVFRNPPSVYSYELALSSSRGGMFESYFPRFQRRHTAIAAACDNFPGGVVRYVDIQRFYPSLSHRIARETWARFAEMGDMTNSYRQLGESLIAGYFEASNRAGGVLTGPMFSHLLGNLVLRHIDEELAAIGSVRYLRYVDDIVLVGTPDSVSETLELLRYRLEDLDLVLHDDDGHKSFEVPGSIWLEGRNDFQHEPGQDFWAAFIGDLKSFLLMEPGSFEDLRSAFLAEGIRIPILDYSQTAREVSFVSRVRDLSRYAWYRHRKRALSIPDLVARARRIREFHYGEAVRISEAMEGLRGFRRKRYVPKLRYYAGRLVYLATDEMLTDLGAQLKNIPELRLYGEVMTAVASGNVNRILSLGVNAAQATAQALRAAQRVGSVDAKKFGEAEKQSIAILLLNGVQLHEIESVQALQSEFVDFAVNGADEKLISTQDDFLRELACLHGISSKARHPQVLETGFDRDEALVMDAVTQLGQSLSS